MSNLVIIHLSFPPETACGALTLPYTPLYTVRDYLTTLNVSYNTGKSTLPDIYTRRLRASAYISGKA